MKSTEIKPRELCRLVWNVVKNQPERHDQALYTNLERAAVIGTVRKYADRPMPPGYDPEAWDTWARPVCQTTGCVAGWAALLSAPVTWKVDDTDLIPGGLREPIGIEDYAQERMGITGVQGKWLFSGARTSEEVLWALDYLASHPDAENPDLPDQSVVLGRTYHATVCGRESCELLGTGARS